MAARVGRRLVAAGALAIVLIPATAHADAARPTEWRSEIVSVTPPTDAVDVSIEGGDAFVRIDVESGHEVVVEGYAGEPYLWIDAQGSIHENRHSPATYLNRDMTGMASVPPEADPTADPDWERIGDGGSWAFHDHRAHYMGGAPPQDMRAGESLPDTRIPISVDGVPTVIAVRTTLAASPSPWPAVLGALIGLALAAATLLPAIPAAAGVLPIALAATWVGIVQYTSLPSETGPRLVWWLPAALAVVCGVATLLMPRRAVYVRSGLTLVAAVQLVVWGFARRGGLTHAVLPTSAPFWLDRLVTAAALAGGLALLAIAAYDLARSLRVPAPSTATSVTVPTPQP
jgi:hypothetical protein